MRLATAERCLASEWNEEKGRFRKSFAGYQDANDALAALAPKVTATDLPPAPLLTDLLREYVEVLRARGFRLLVKRDLPQTLLLAGPKQLLFFFFGQTVVAGARNFIQN